MRSNTILYKWWLMVSLQLLFTGISLFFYDLFSSINEYDKTGLSWVIILAFLLQSFVNGFHAYQLANNKFGSRETKFLPGWFTSDLVVTLGLLGTVIGFLIMLGKTFHTINLQDQQSVYQAITTMAYGMATALYTTACGIIASIFIKMQLVLLEQYYYRKLPK